MKTKRLLSRALAITAALTCAIGANAYDFAASGLYLNIISGNNVEVTYNDNNSSYTSYTGNVTIPSTVTYQGTTYNVTRIGNNAFRASTGLTGVTIPSSITKIGYFAFYECSNLKSISIPTSVTNIQHDAFGKTGLTNAYIPNTVTYLGSEAFYNCTNLRSVTLSKNITLIDMRTFEGCTSLTSIDIPEGVTSIEADAFDGCTSLYTVTMPTTLTTIKRYAFYGCTALNKVTCYASTPPSLYDSSVFPTAAYNNATLNVPNSVKSAYQAANGWKLFNNINGLPYDFVLDNLKYLITSSSTVKCMGSVLPSPYGAWSIHDTANGYDVTEIGEDAFNNCSNMTSIKIGNKVKKIYGAAFCGCSGLTTVTIPNSVTWVGGLVFFNCTSLTSVVIGKNCRFNTTASWSVNIFEGCTSLTDITCLSEQPWYYEDPMFPESVYENAVLWVPNGSQSAYRQTSYWKRFSHIKGIRTLDEALNVPGGDLHFTTSGQYPWVVMVNDNDEAYAQSGNGSVHNSTSVLSCVVTVENGGFVEFFLSARGEEGSRIYDECRFEIDGAEVFSLGVLSPDSWARNRSELTPGTHTLTWSYTKDDSVHPEGDYFAITGVELLPNEFIRGDVDGDGSVGIGDLTTLIDYILNGDSSEIDINAADCDQSGDINIGDSTTLIDFLLSGSW